MNRHEPLDREIREKTLDQGAGDVAAMQLFAVSMGVQFQTWVKGSNGLENLLCHFVVGGLRGGRVGWSGEGIVVVGRRCVKGSVSKTQKF